MPNISPRRGNNDCVFVLDRRRRRRFLIAFLLDGPGAASVQAESNAQNACLHRRHIAAFGSPQELNQPARTRARLSGQVAKPPGRDLSGSCARRGAAGSPRAALCPGTLRQAVVRSTASLPTGAGAVGSCRGFGASSPEYPAPCLWHDLRGASSGDAKQHPPSVFF